ncbi:hypothetical protein [Kitasatospora sp. NPDC047058]|uniref:hypothetical protein n=1 Tax=Kitasatospora sp. NPDC047058 TaxID=3155620 RepID=UPI0033D7499B
MTTLLVHDTNSAWTSTHPALEVTTEGRKLLDREVTVNRLRFSGGPTEAVAEFVPDRPLDLTEWDELRVWIRAEAPADGTTACPFYLALSYEDAEDTLQEQHRWFVPVNEPQVWEQRVIGISADRRGAVVRFRVETVGTTAFTTELFRLVAVREEMLEDIERALGEALSGMSLPGLTRVPVRATANPGDSTVTLDYAPGMAAGNRIFLEGSPLGDEVHDVVGAEHDRAAGRTRLTFPEASPLVGTFTAGTSFASVTVPVAAESASDPDETVTPRVVLSCTDVREDPERTGYIAQRDSFRPRGRLTACAVRPPARAFHADYQVSVFGGSHAAQVTVHNGVLSRLSADRALWINEAPVPVEVLPPPPLEERTPRQSAPVYVRVGSRMQTGPREELPWVRRTEVRAGRPDVPGDDEGVGTES